MIKLNEGYSWDTVGSRGFSNAFSIYFCLAITKQGTPIVSYLEATGEISQLKVQKFNSANSKWEDMGFPIKSYGNWIFSMLLDKNDSLFIALSSHESGGEGQVWKYSGSAWSRVGGSLFPAGTYNMVVLKEDPSGRKYAAYNEVANGGGFTLKAFIGEKWIACGPPVFTPKAQGNSPATLDFDPTGIPHLQIQDMTNGSRLTVFKTGFDP